MPEPSLTKTMQLVQQTPQVVIYDLDGRPQRSPWQILIQSILRIAKRLANLSPDNGGLRLPSYTTAQRNLITARPGEMIWNSTEAQAEIWDGSAWEVFWTPAENASIGLSQQTAAATGLAAGSTANFVLPLPASFVNINAMTFEVSNITPGATISSFDVALYDTQANRDAGTFSTTDTGLQMLAPGLTEASTGPGTAQWAVLGLMQGSLNGSTSVMWGKVRNNDGANAFDGTIAVEAYGQRGARAV